jgi:chemotaxis protein MotB
MKRNNLISFLLFPVLTFALASCTAKYERKEQELGRQISDLNEQLEAEKNREKGLINQIDDLRKNLDSEKAKSTALQKQLADLQVKLETEKANEAALQKKLADLERQLDSGKEADKKQQKLIADLRQQIEADKAREATFQKQIGDLTRGLASQTLKVKEIQKQLDGMNRLLELQKAEAEKEIKKNEETYNKLVASLKDEMQKDEVTINKYKNALTINIAERILFDLGRAEIKPQFYPVLNKVGKIIKNLPDKFIQVEGHTDDIPIAEEYQWKIPNNWALGARRAINVTIYFIDKFNIDPHKIAVMSFSKYRPLVPNTSAQNRAKNRRIEIVILDQSLYQEMERKQGL